MFNKVSFETTEYRTAEIARLHTKDAINLR